MATGAADANGIWIYGEDDNESTHSALLNKLGNSVSTTVTRLEEMSGLTAAQLNTHRDNLGVGLVNVVPTSVAQAGGSASANAQGLVTFTGVTSLSLNGVFTSNYKNYHILLEGLHTSSIAETLFKFRSGGVDSTSADYNYAGYYAINNPAQIQSNAALNSTRGTLGYLATLGGACVFSILAPQESNKTKWVYSGSTYHNNGVLYSVAGSGVYNVITSYDGFTIYPAAGNISGTIQVFGYNN